MKASRQQYIEQYAEYAMEQMRRYGIPASVTLAQGIIESADGRSTLSQTANNHFGVKGTYNGNYVLANDDRPNEKFKKYDNVGQSYEDHSKVLMADRYQRYVRNLSPDDYKGWAAAIKKGGYATAANYVSTIVSVIEGNDLHKYDQMVMQQMRSEGKSFGVDSKPLSQKESTDIAKSQTQRKTTGYNLPQGEYSMPVKRDEFMLVTSPYGKRKDPIVAGKTQMHHGIDIKTHHESVLATENGGTVIGVDNRTTTGGGKTVTVEYTRSDGTKTQVQYMHLDSIDVKKGDTVRAGQRLGVSGNTGTRTTGEHLHLGVINVSADGKLQWVNPAAYLAEISAKGNIRIEAQHNGKDLLAAYKVTDTSTQPQSQSKDEQQTPESWMSKLLGSNDAALGDMGFGGESGLLGSLMQMFMTMLMLSMRMEGKSNDEKMQAVSDALTSRRLDLSGFVPSLKSAELSVKDNGKAILSTDDGQHQYTHELTEAEKSRLSQIVSSDSDDASKRQKVGNMVMAITYSRQAAENYEQIESQQRSQEQTL